MNFEVEFISRIVNFEVEFIPVIYDTRKKGILKELSPESKRSE